MAVNNRLRPVAGYLVEILGEEIVLFHPELLKIAHLNRTAALIWGLCDGERSEADICVLLADAYPDSAEDMKQDVRDTISLFKSIGALEEGEI
ncbi:MAG: PqqD family protein [Dehalococcoidia bacterium]|nr:PqqD family protein [Dehalococcoidia bacterium]